MRYEKATEGIRVWVQPRFSLAESDPAEGTFVFSYQVSLANEGAEPARLLFRHWRIHDSAAGDSLVDGEGVIGQQPLIAPGGSHEYSSFCVLRSPVGYMEGHYTFARPDGSRFRVEVPRFHLSGPLVLPQAGRETADREVDPRVMN
jgi:ApaG protein